MPSKRRKLSFHDLPPASKAGQASANRSDDVTGGATVTVGAPQNVALTSGIIYASAAPQSYIQIDFDPPETTTGQRPDRYTIQVSTTSDFTASGTITVEYAPDLPDAPLARVDGLPPGILHYVRLRAIVGGFPGAWTSMSPLTDNVNRITTAQDLSAAAQVTSLTAIWVGTGDLLITWVNGTSANWKDNQVIIKASSGGATLRTVDTAAAHLLYTFSMNYTDTSGAPDNNLYVEVRSRTFSNVLNNTAVPNVTSGAKVAPATPTGFSQSWSGDTGTAGPDLTLAWTRADDAARYTLTLNGVARTVNANRYTYTLDANRAENSGTADPTISYSLLAVDSFGTASTAVSGTATNAAPAAPVATLTTGAVAGLFATVTSTPPADFWRYEFVFKRDGSTVATVFSTGATYQYEMQAAGDADYHSWTVVVRQEDLFAQFSATHTPAAVAGEGLTLAWLRSGAIYSDSAGNTDAALRAALADSVTDSGGISYAA